MARRSRRRSGSGTGSGRFDEVRRMVLEGDGLLEGSIRRAAFDSGTVPPSLETYVTKVRTCAYKVTDDDVAALRSAGWSEEQIFELTVATALGAALARHDRARAAMTEVR